jgi:putative endonuclease
LRGERVAARYLRRHHHRLLVRNYHCVAGEIDLVCTHGDTIVFVEVKTRTSEDAEDVQDALRSSQWRRIEQAARYFLMQHSAQNQPCRFDLITVLWPPGQSPKIEHFQNVHHPCHQ